MEIGQKKEERVNRSQKSKVRPNKGREETVKAGNELREMSVLKDECVER